MALKIVKNTFCAQKLNKNQLLIVNIGLFDLILSSIRQIIYEFKWIMEEKLSAAISQILFPEGRRPFIYAIRTRDSGGASYTSSSIWSCTGWGLPCRSALAASAVVSYTTFSPLPPKWRYIFCGAFLTVLVAHSISTLRWDILLCGVWTFLYDQVTAAVRCRQRYLHNFLYKNIKKYMKLFK